MATLKNKSQKPPRLVLPSVKYKQSFLNDFLKYQGKPALEWDSWGKYQDQKVLKNRFAGFVKYLKSQRKGLNLPPGYIPQTVYWLVDKNTFIGILCLRHRLTKRLSKIGGHIGYEIALKFRGKGYGNLILKLGLKKAEQMGIKNVLVTCDITNLKSKKIIESSGGEFVGQSSQGKGLPKKLRFKIKI